MRKVYILAEPLTGRNAPPLTYSRVDTPGAQDFISCVRQAIDSHSDDRHAGNKAACECGSENYFGLCDVL